MTSANLSPSATPVPGPFSIRIKRLELPRLQTDRLSSVNPSLPSVLQLSEGFGTVYVGEQFRALVHVSATETVSDVSVSLSMRTSMPDVSLLKSDTIEQMSDGEGRDFVIHCDTTSPGLHQIVCSLEYTEIDSSLQSVFTRVFKFQVQPPFTLSHWISNSSAKFFSSIEFTNLIQASIVVKSVQFLLNPSSIAPVSTDFTIDDQFDKEITLNESECFCTTSIITWNRASDTERPPFSLSGRFQIHWCQIVNGEPGSFKSSMINFISPDDLKISVVEAPASAHLETVFTIQLLISNANQIDRNDIRIEFVRDRLSYLRPSGSIVQNIGRIAQGSNLKHSIDIVGLATGIHSLNGIRLHCPSTGRVYDFDQLCQIEIIR